MSKAPAFPKLFSKTFYGKKIIEKFQSGIAILKKITFESLKFKFF
jgi:hypothetical protein